MVVMVMRHGKRDRCVDSSLLGFNRTDLENSCPELWKTIETLVVHDLNTIITSPYLRTRQTAELVQYGLLKLTGKYLPIIVDTRIGEYMHRRCSWKRPTTDEFDPKTVEYFKGRVPLCRESPDMAYLRIYQFHQTIRDGSLIVTHAGVTNLLGGLCKQLIQLDVGQCATLTMATGETSGLAGSEAN